MKMNKSALLFKCNNCEAAIRPLTFFDGSVWCPNCRTNLFIELNLKADNRESVQTVRDPSFSISQELFAKYLCEGGGRDVLRSAINYCRKAAYALDPYALLNLGYFYSLGYVDSVHIETGRAFARLCFEIAKKCSSDVGEDFSSLVERNLQALQSPLKKSDESDTFYLKELTERIWEGEKATAPRLGVFSIENSGEETDKAAVIRLLEELYKNAVVYLLKQNADGKNPFNKITNSNQFKKCFERENETLWFAFMRKGEPLKAYKKAISGILGNEKELQQNLSVIISEMKKLGNRGVDFSDQNVLICTFTDRLNKYYGADGSKEYSAFDRLSWLYRKIQGDK